MRTEATHWISSEEDLPRPEVRELDLSYVVRFDDEVVFYFQGPDTEQRRERFYAMMTMALEEARAKEVEGLTKKEIQEEHPFPLPDKQEDRLGHLIDMALQVVYHLEDSPHGGDRRVATDLDEAIKGACLAFGHKPQ